MGWREELNQYFEKGAKKEHGHELGLEIEHFIVKSDTLEAVPYGGENGIRSVLGLLAKRYPEAVVIGKEDILGLETAEFTITLEPAAQLEISIAKSFSVRKIRSVYRSFRQELDKILEGFGYKALTVGCQSKTRVEDIALIPQERYRLMDRHFKDTGDGGIQMMRGTCSVQVSVDYYSEEDFRRKIQAAYYYMPMLKILTDHSDSFEGVRINGHLKRTDIWSRTDKTRYGIPAGIFEPGYGFDSYASFLGRMPLIYRERGEEAEPTGLCTVSQLYEGATPDEKEIRHILSMAFPDVRLKSYLEIRFADSMPEEYLTAYCALVKGLIYQEASLDHVQDMIKEGSLTENDVKTAEQSLMQKGWDGYVYGRPVRSAARDMLRLADMYLTDEEKRYADVFRNVIDAGGIMAMEAAKGRGKLTSSSIREQYVDLIQNNMKKNMEGALALKENMERSPLYFRDRITSKTLQIPRIYTEEDIDRFRHIVKIAYSVFDKVIREYIRDADYRALFPFPKELEELILIPNRYASLLPIARFDIFYHEDTGDFYFCEINTDGTSGMNEDRLQDELILDNPAQQEMRRRYRFRTFELFDRWVRCFLDLYDTYPDRVKKPNVAIVDFLDSGTVREFQEFARHFQKAGVDCEICDIRSLTYSNGKLYSGSGNVIDAIYRRAVTADIMEHAGDVSAFLTAVREGACFVAGSFATQIIHHKWLFYVLHHERTKKILTTEENEFVRRHIPGTLPFSEGYITREKVLKDKDSYILKPDDSYASNGVWAGVEYTDAEWEERIDLAYGKGYICQEYCPQYSTENIDFAWGDGNWHSYISMAGLYVYNGDFAGVFSRCATGDGIIASHRNERTQATYVVSDFIAG